jgi:dTDP-4-amino-4,6-dideoxygalactose transaminase
VLPNLKAYSYLNHNGNAFPEATKTSQKILSLPMYPELEVGQIEFIANEIKEFSIRNRVII